MKDQTKEFKTMMQTTLMREAMEACKAISNCEKPLQVFSIAMDFTSRIQAICKGSMEASDGILKGAISKETVWAALLYYEKKLLEDQNATQFNIQIKE